MKPPDLLQLRFGSETTKIDQSRTEEARQIIEDHANDLREIIKKLRRRRLN